MDELTQNQNAVALSAQVLTQDIAEAHEAMGMIKAFEFVEKLLTVSSLKVLSEIKNTKKYKGLQYIDNNGKVLTVSSWEQYCLACGLTHQKVNEDLRNLSDLGEDFLETSQRLGLGYREMRKLRKLPDEAKAQIIDADYSETTDKEELIEKIEDLTALYSKEKAELETKLKRKTEDYEAQGKVLANKNEQINRLDIELEKKKKWIENLPADKKGGELRDETNDIAYRAEAVIRGQLHNAFKTLTEHTAESGICHKQFMVGVLASIELAVNELRDCHCVPDVATGSHRPEWLDFKEGDTSLGEQLAAIENS
ncbi:hypothetical protein QJU89_05935 [Pasteurella skyensis]|uniref:Uncharacterized protein n=1 Tax=Phocoenobacter skyensis TaxID=97481 RepID=A0AAJ6N991_9PAST|nr:hypothetical protein [Pasteurella skyensis]MDP8162831.1 hypothetical protein [Pasteurella skyensis]MDP8172582.1 hypothetical protein [Pasteurella skyensis]MDP8179082.1 hypothetical protein [Pasteurella skyensis]MDP8183233.1 hypothetical protein [Pasteurella skyensis]MDP8189284.1 hypothetical protein [Pasteurella skyensis]